MAGINLAQGARQEEVKNKEKRSKRGVVLVAVFLVLVLGAWGGLVWYEGMLSADIEGLEREIETVRGEISGADLSRIADFYFRLDAVEEGLESMRHPHLILGTIERNIDSSVELSSISFDEEEREVVLEGIAGEFQAIVRQLVALKSAEEISSVALQRLNRNDDGRFDFVLSVYHR